MLNAKIIETIGTVSGIIGALLVATKNAEYGYPVFLTSSVCLLISAYKQKNKNLIWLQSAFLATNLLGLVNYI